MGKASRWIVNFLLGKKEEKEKRKNISLFEDYTRTPMGSIPSTPTYKRRWSFGRSSASKEKVHKSSKSLDAITPLISQHAALLEWEKLQNHNKMMRTPSEALLRVVATRHAADRIIRSIEDAAATRIQAAYRSYLARKALCALRALVKIQALVRGHLVRKKITATLRQMHALMTIQVRARFQRIQMAEESSHLAIRSQSSRHGNFFIDNGSRGAYKEIMDLNIFETKRVLKENTAYLNNSKLERRKHGVTKFYSGELYVSKRKREQRYEEFSFPTAVNTPKICSPTHQMIPGRASFTFENGLSSPQISSPTQETIPGRASFTYEKPDYIQPISFPSYMANTESSRAKVRSQSEPKQRPKGSVKSKPDLLQDSPIHEPSIPMQVAYENQDPWFSKNSEYDAMSIGSSSYSNHNKFFSYEPKLNLY